MTKPGKTTTHVKILVTLSKQEKASDLIDAFQHSKIKFLSDSAYDIYLIRDCDASVLYMALNV